MRHDGVSTANPLGTTSMLAEPFNQSGSFERANVKRLGSFDRANEKRKPPKMREISSSQTRTAETALSESTATVRHFPTRLILLLMMSTVLKTTVYAAGRLMPSYQLSLRQTMMTIRSR